MDELSRNTLTHSLHSCFDHFFQQNSTFLKMTFNKTKPFGINCRLKSTQNMFIDSSAAAISASLAQYSNWYM